MPDVRIFAAKNVKRNVRIGLSNRGIWFCQLMEITRN